MRPLEVRISGPAARIHLTPQQYLAHLAAGEKWCWVHQRWESADSFYDVSNDKNPCKEATRRLALASYYRRRDLSAPELTGAGK